MRDCFNYIQGGERRHVVGIEICHFRGAKGRFLSRRLALFVGIYVTAAERVGALGETNSLLAKFVGLDDAGLPHFISGRYLSELRFFGFLRERVRYYLGREAFEYRGDCFVVLVPRDEASPPQVAGDRELAASNRSTSGVSPVPLFAKEARRVNGVSVLFGGANSTRSHLPFYFYGVGRTFCFPVRAVPCLFRRGVDVNVFTQVLSSDYGANGGLVRVHRVRVATGNRILNAPIIPSRGQVGVEGAKFSNNEMSRVSRVRFANGKRNAFNGVDVIRLFENRVFGVTLCNLGGLDGNAQSWYALARRVFFSQVNYRFRADRSNTFLSAVILLLRRRMRLVRSVRPHSMLLLMVFRQFRRTCRNGTAFVLWLFRLACLLFSGLF